MAVNIPFPLLRNTEANNTELILEMETQECISLYLYTYSHNARARGSKKKIPMHLTYDSQIKSSIPACLVF